MVDYLLDDEVNLEAVVDFWIVNQDGSFNNRGEYIWVSDFYVNPKCRNIKSTAKFAERVIAKVPYAKYCYFVREKYGKKIMYHKDRWLRIINRSLKKEMAYV